MCDFIYFCITTMNKLFRKMLALLAAAVLVGQTMFTSIVSAVEAEGLNDSVDWEVVNVDESDTMNENSDVDDLSIKNLIEVKDLTKESLDLEPINLEVNDSLNLADVNKIDVDSNTSAWDDSRIDGSESNTCVSESDLWKLAKALDESVPNWFYVRENNWQIYLYVEDSIKLDVSDVTLLIDLLLSGDPESISDEWIGFFWKEMYRNGFEPTISNVTQLIDVILNWDGLKVWDIVDISSRGGCFTLNVVGWKPVDLCSRNDTLNSLINNKLNVYFANELKSRYVYANLVNGEIVINYENSNGLISYVTALIDYILTDWNVEDNSNEMSLWKSLGEDYVLDISTVTALIDLSLSDSSYFTVKTREDGCSFGNVVVRFQKIEPSTPWVVWGYETCDKVDVKWGNLKLLADKLNQRIESKWLNWLTMSSDGTTLYLAVKEWTDASFSISTITSLIDYLLNDSVNDLEWWWYIWQSMLDAWFVPNISNLTELIDFNLAGWDLVPWKSIPVYSNEWCFNLIVVADNWNWGNGDNNNSYSWGGSSSGGGSSSRNNSANDDELEFRWEVVEPQVADSCSIKWSTLSDEENQAYLWACENWMILADNVMKANFASPLTRAELDKMMSVYAKQLLGRSYVVNENVSYPDVDNSLWDLPYYIQEWYKLQIMWIHANGSALTKFMPRLLVTRWEFATVFSRVLYGNLYNIDGANYYEKHLQVLKDAGILTNTNPSLVEARGWVVLMLYRSQKVEKSNWKISNEEVAEITWE